MSDTVLVTGGSGFIGSHVVDRLRAAGYTPRIFDVRPSPWHADVDTVIGDLLSAADVARAAHGCAAICHLGAAADVGEVVKAPGPSTELNTTGTLNVLEAARACGITRVVYASTVWVYSDVQADAVDEETLLPPPAHLYTAGKLSGELMCRSYAELYGLQPTILRFGIPYGPRARPAAVIPQFVERALRGEPVSIAGSGEQERAFVYVEDLAEGVVRGLQPQAAGRTYNLAGQETTTIRGLADIVSEVVAPTEIVHTPGRAGDLKGTHIRSDRAHAELGWQASTPLRDGVRAYATWLQAQAPAPAPAEAVAAVAVARPAARASQPRAARRFAGHLARLGGDTTFVCAASVVAVASATLVSALGAPDTAQTFAYALVGLCALVPLLPLLLLAWPEDRRRLQGAVAAALATVSVVTLGTITEDGGVHLTGMQSLLLVFACVGLTSAMSAASSFAAD